MEGFVFLITDKHHKVYYASQNANNVFGESADNLRNKNWIKSIHGPSANFVSTLLDYDIKNLGYFNAYLSFKPDGQLWYCDYGKRFDKNGQQVGFELIVVPVSKDASDYMTHFYENLEQKVSSGQHGNEIEVYQQEQQLIAETTGTEFHEFLLALQS